MWSESLGAIVVTKSSSLTLVMELLLQANVRD